VWAGRSVLDEICFESEIARETIELWLEEFESAEDADDSEPSSMTSPASLEQAGLV
jgi:hypothetical protein